MSTLYYIYEWGILCFGNLDHKMSKKKVKEYSLDYIIIFNKKCTPKCSRKVDNLCMKWCYSSN